MEPLNPSIGTLHDVAAFTRAAERHRRELQVHCYRMLGSFEDAEDLVQETFLRAWRRRETYEGRASFRAWLYRIATNACLDALKRRPRVLVPAGATAAEIPWLQPYPDDLLEGIAPSGDEPEAAIVAKETIELAFLVAIQHLPPNQRAVLILRDVLGWSANETASLLDTSVASANSALQRARATLKRHLSERRVEWGPEVEPSAEERALLQRYVEAHERSDVAGMAALLREDVVFSMPPDPEWRQGREDVIGFWVEAGFGTNSFGEFRAVLTRANLQPAVAFYLRKPGEQEFRAMALDVLRIEDGAIAEVTTFVPELFRAFGLAPVL